MKNSCIIFFLSFIIILASFVAFGAEKTQNVDGYLRVHIRANSNLETDQSVKYLVRDGIVEYLTPVVAECKTKEEAQKAITESLDEISLLATTILRENGYSYQGRALLKRESFPTRVYGEYTLPNGVYDALIVELGEAKGDNWWCVIYPPLCFAGGNLTAGNIVYKSKIVEIINEWKNKTDGAGAR